MSRQAMPAGTMHTISSHTGKEYERGLLPSAPVTTLPHPGVEVVDGREPESVGYWPFLETVGPVQRQVSQAGQAAACAHGTSLA